MTNLTLHSLFNEHLPNVGYNSSSTHLFRIYLSPGRFATAYMPIAERNNHPDWWMQQAGLKSFMDELIISEYMFNKADVLTPFLATIVQTFNIPEAGYEAVADQFLACVRQINADTVTFEQAMRDTHAEIH